MLAVRPVGDASPAAPAAAWSAQPVGRARAPGDRRHRPAARRLRSGPRRRRPGPQALGLPARPAPASQAGRCGRRAPGLGEACASWPPGSACAGGVVRGPSAVGGPGAPASALPPALRLVAVARRPAHRGLLSRCSTVLSPPPTAQPVAPWTSARPDPPGRTGGRPLTAGDLPGATGAGRRLPLPRRRSLLRGGGAGVFTPALAFAWRARRGPRLALAGPHHAAAGVPCWGGRPMCPAVPEGDAAAAPAVTPEPWAPATGRAADDPGGTCPSAQPRPFTAHHAGVRGQGCSAAPHHKGTRAGDVLSSPPGHGLK